MKNASPTANHELSKESAKVVLKYETLLVNEKGEESWFCGEFEFDSTDHPEFMHRKQLLARLTEDNLARNIEVVVRGPGTWLI